jgi:hypothetical protein
MVKTPFLDGKKTVLIYPAQFEFLLFHIRTLN